MQPLSTQITQQTMKQVLRKLCWVILTADFSFRALCQRFAWDRCLAEPLMNVCMCTSSPRAESAEGKQFFIKECEKCSTSKKLGVGNGGGWRRQGETSKNRLLLLNHVLPQATVLYLASQFQERSALHSLPLVSYYYENQSKKALFPVLVLAEGKVKLRCSEQMIFRRPQSSIGAGGNTGVSFFGNSDIEIKGTHCSGDA